MSFKSLAVLCALVASAAASNPKRGVAYIPGDTPNDINKAANSQISWEYSWQTGRPYPAAAGVQHVAMQWGEADIGNVAGAVADFAVVLGFNEPERGDQANMTPQHAADLWRQYMNPLAGQGKRLGAPAVSSAPEGGQWLADFMAACSDCNIDFIPFHWYGDGAQWFIEYAQNLHNTYPNKPLWVTEWASTNGDAQAQKDFLTDTVNFLDTTDYIERYSWFAFGRNANGLPSQLLDGNGNVNALGALYV